MRALYSFDSGHVNVEFLFLTANSVNYLSEDESGSNCIPYFVFYFGGRRAKIYEVAK